MIGSSWWFRFPDPECLIVLCIITDWRKIRILTIFGFDVQSLFVWVPAANIFFFPKKCVGLFDHDISCLWVTCRLLYLQFIVLVASTIFLLVHARIQRIHGLGWWITLIPRLCGNDMWHQCIGQSPLLQLWAMEICMQWIRRRWYLTFSICSLILG